jgi:dTDP-glucose 4,6-dehydratase
VARTYLVTGGAGFIGSAFIRRLLARPGDIRVINLDKLTYAGRPENVASVAGDPRYRFVKGDIADPAVVGKLFAEAADRNPIDVAVNFAAESHVDRAITDPGHFITTDMYGVYVLLEAARAHGLGRFVQISTDEVYGSVEHGSSVETDPLMPRNPYAASKAGGDRLAFSYFATYGLDVIVTRASNNYGPYQYPEKFVPLFVTNAIEGEPMPLYGDGRNVRDWLHVDDHCAAIEFLIEHGRAGEVYNIGGGNERENIEVARLICAALGKPDSLIRLVKDRPGHDRRYSLDSSKLAALGWTPRVEFETGLRETVQWYVENRAWWEPIKSGEFRQYYERHYGGR